MWLQHKFVRPPTQKLQNDINKKTNCCRLGLSLPALGDEDRKNMFAAMDENGDGTIIILYGGFLFGTGSI